MNSRCPHIPRNRGIALPPLTLPAVVAVFVKLENGVSRSLLFCAGGVLFERFHVLVSAGRLPITQIDFSTFRLLVPFELGVTTLRRRLEKSGNNLGTTTNT